MVKWKILHLVGGDISIWRGLQIQGQISILPDEFFEHHLAAGECSSAGFLENQFLIPVNRLGLRAGIDLLAARNLGKLIKKLEPDLIVCWDIPATEQLKLAVLGRRKKIPSVAMIFNRIEEKNLLPKLLSNYHRLGLHIVCGSSRVRKWLAAEISDEKRIHHIPPVVNAGLKGVSRKVIRRQMGFDPEGLFVFVVSEGRRGDILKAIHSGGIVQTLCPSVCVIIAGKDKDFSYRCKVLGERELLQNIVRTVDYEDAHRMLCASDLVIHPCGGFDESLVLVDAIGASVPVITTNFAEPADMLLPGKTCLYTEISSPQKIAKVVYNFLCNIELRNTIVKNAEELVESKYSKLSYRSSVVKLFREMINTEVKKK